MPRFYATPYFPSVEVPTSGQVPLTSFPQVLVRFQRPLGPL